MSTPSSKTAKKAQGKPTILPCNFRSAGRLSNESARTLTGIHEVLARNLTNSLDVYLGTGLEVRFVDLQQLSIEEYRLQCANAGYVLPSAVRPSQSSAVIELDSSLMFTVVDLLLGGSGASPEVTRELTEIDEEIIEGVATLIVGQIERVWQPMGFAFPPTEKILRIHFDVSVGGISGSLHLALQASLASHLVRNSRIDAASARNSARYLKLPPLKQRILDCNFSLSGELAELKVSVRDLARLEVGTVLALPAAASAPGKITLEGRPYFEASPVGQGNKKAMQLLLAIDPNNNEMTDSEDQINARS